MAKKATKKAGAKGAPKAETKRTKGGVIVEALKAGKGAKAALEAVLKEFPDAKTTMACVYWYASKEGIKLQGTAAKKEKKVHKVAVPAKKAGKKFVTRGKGRTLQTKKERVASEAQPVTAAA